MIVHAVLCFQTKKKDDANITNIQFIQIFTAGDVAALIAASISSTISSRWLC